MIGVFDSGLGGLSVLDALVRALPRADFTYVADTAHMPYGDKSDDFIRARVLAIGDALVARGCTLLVVACNTATAAAVQTLRAVHPQVPVVGIEPGIKPAALSTRTKHIAVLVTESTARSARLAALLAAHAKGIQVDVVPCPGWATQVEQLRLDDPALAADVAARIAPVVAGGADRLVLGCTHYGFLRPLLLPLAAGRAELIDVADAVARQALRLYGERLPGCGALVLLATAQPDRLRHALPALGLASVSNRVAQINALDAS